jgi:uncharacterized protein
MLERPRMGRPVVHWEINAKDAGALSRFYAQLFDWKVDASELDHAYIETGTEEGIDGSIAQTDPGDPTGLTMYVHVDDVAAALAKAQKLGGRVAMEPTEMPDGVTLAVFEDPEGNQIGLVEG